MLGGQEYLRSMSVIDYYGAMHLYLYARKLDDNLMCIVEISVPTGTKIEDIEKLFS